MPEEIQVPENVNPKEYFEQILPKQFEIAKQQNPIEGMEGTEFSLQCDVDGPNGGSWSVIVKDAKDMEIREGPYENALLTLQLSESDWRDSVTGKIGPTMDVNTQLSGSQAKSQFAALKNTKGKLITELKKPDESVFPTTIIFNKADNPVTTIRMNVEDYIAMAGGELDGQTAFMQGKLQIEGDMMFAMQLSQFRF